MSDKPQADGQSDAATTAAPAHARCAAVLQNGQRCRNYPQAGRLYCRVHRAMAVADPPAEPAESSAMLSDSAAPPPAALDPNAPLADSSVVADVELEIQNRVASTDPVQAWQQELAAGLLKLIRQNLERMQPGSMQEALDRLHSRTRDYLDPDFWRGIGMLLEYQIKELSAFIQRRVRGEYQTDPYGLDTEVVDLVRPFFAFMYHTWWRISTDGMAHVPSSGRALLVSNHSGVFPWDGAMIGTAILEEHPEPRVIRSLFLDWFSTLPAVEPFLTSLGQVQGLPENAVRLLEEEELVCVFPEGLKGVGKLFKDRYRLARFGRGGFVQAALRTGAPLIPVAVVGAEETYPMLANLAPLARLLGMPYFPITPFFPWFGLAGLIPLPSRWNLTFCAPIPTAQYGPAAADDPLVVLNLAEQVRSVIQETINRKLAERTNIF